MKGSYDGPAFGRRVLKFDGLWPRGLWIARRAMLIKSALRDWLSVSYGIVSILVISRCAAPPYPAAPLDAPAARGFRRFRRFKGFRGWW